MIYDMKTKNDSFKLMSYNLKTKGVKNNKFFLALYDEGLSGIDPFDEDLPLDIKLRIFKEATNNFWYYVRELSRIPAKGYPKGVQFDLNVGNLALLYSFYYNFSYMIVLPRQVGKTQGEICGLTWAIYFSNYANEAALLHARGDDGSKENLGRLKSQRDLLPKYIQDFIKDKDDIDNVYSIASKKRKNKITTFGSATTDDMADKLGRGGSLPLVIWDEFGFTGRSKIIWNSLIPAWTTSALGARESGSANYGVHLLTTPNNLDKDNPDFPGTFAYSVKTGGCRFEYSFYDMSPEDLHDYVKKNSEQDIIYIEYDWKECGKTQEWFDENKKKMDPVIFKREVLLEWISPIDNPVFNPEALAIVDTYTKPVAFKLNINNYNIEFYEKPNFKTNYILSCDLSGAQEQDYSIILILAPDDFRVVGMFRNNGISFDYLKDLIIELMSDYFMNSLINVERNYTGIAMLDSLMHIPFIEPRIYREVLKKQAEKTTTEGRVVKKKTNKICYGTTTSSATRPRMLSQLITIVNEEPYVFQSKQFYEELRTLTRDKNDKIAAAYGFHDDIIMAYLITRYALSFGTWFQTKQNISSIPTPSNVKQDGSGNFSVAAFTGLVQQANSISSSSNSQTEYDEMMLMWREQSLRQASKNNNNNINPNQTNNFINNICSWNKD